MLVCLRANPAKTRFFSPRQDSLHARLTGTAYTGTFLPHFRDGPGAGRTSRPWWSGCRFFTATGQM